MTSARQILEESTASSFLDPKNAAKCFAAGRCFRDSLSGQPRLPMALCNNKRSVLVNALVATSYQRLSWLSCCLPPYRNGVGILILRLLEAQ
jgi:hypothetical protein